MRFPQLTVQDYGRGAYLVTTAEKPIPLRSVAYVGDESTQILNANDGETARRFAYLFAAAPELFAAIREAHEFLNSLLSAEPDEATDFLTNNGEKVNDVIFAAILAADPENCPNCRQTLDPNDTRCPTCYEHV